MPPLTRRSMESNHHPARGSSPRTRRRGRIRNWRHVVVVPLDPADRQAVHLDRKTFDRQVRAIAEARAHRLQEVRVVAIVVLRISHASAEALEAGDEAVAGADQAVPGASSRIKMKTWS